MSETLEIAKGNARSSGYERNANDYYAEPVSATAALLRVEGFIGNIHDPACGGGNVLTACRDAGLYATGADIVDRGAGEVRDFLTDQGRYDNIISNPPFGIATDFTLHALRQLTGDRGKVAILQRLAWLEGRERHKRLFGPGHLHAVYTFTNRISMPPGGSDVPAKGGAVAYAWFLFGRASVQSYSGGWVIA